MYRCGDKNDIADQNIVARGGGSRSHQYSGQLKRQDHVSSPATEFQASANRTPETKTSIQSKESWKGMYTSYKEANLDDYAWAIPTLNYGKSAASVQPLEHPVPPAPKQSLDRKPSRPLRRRPRRSDIRQSSDTGPHIPIDTEITVQEDADDENDDGKAQPREQRVNLQQFNGHSLHLPLESLHGSRQRSRSALVPRTREPTSESGISDWRTSLQSQDSDDQREPLPLTLSSLITAAQKSISTPNLGKPAGVAKADPPQNSAMTENIPHHSWSFDEEDVGELLGSLGNSELSSDEEKQLKKTPVKRGSRSKPKLKKRTRTSIIKQATPQSTEDEGIRLREDHHPPSDLDENSETELDKIASRHSTPRRPTPPFNVSLVDIPATNTLLGSIILAQAKAKRSASARSTPTHTTAHKLSTHSAYGGFLEFPAPPPRIGSLGADLNRI